MTHSIRSQSFETALASSKAIDFAGALTSPFVGHACPHSIFIIRNAGYSTRILRTVKRCLLCSIALTEVRLCIRNLALRKQHERTMLPYN